MKVVIVEEDEILIKVITEKLQKERVDVIVARDGEVAHDIIVKQKPDLVLLDLMLPFKNGFEVLKEIKLDSEVSNIPVIVLSNLGQDEDIKKALSAGAADYFVKAQHPINEIIERVKHYLIGAK